MSNACLPCIKGFAILVFLVSCCLCKFSHVKMHDLNFPGELAILDRFQDIEIIGMDLDAMNVSILHKLNSLRNRKEFIKFFGILSSRKSWLIDANELAIDVENAGCTPLLTAVPLMPMDSEVIYYPTCVLLPRCGGCCYGSLLSCQPNEIEKVYLNVVNINQMRTSSSVRGRDDAANMQDVIVVEQERHTKCLCQCILKEKDCNPVTQTYNPDECSCECIDKKNKGLCETRGRTHFWDRTDCRCYCRKVRECSTGIYFEHDTCRCESTNPGAVGSISFDNYNG